MVHEAIRTGCVGLGSTSGEGGREVIYSFGKGAWSYFLMSMGAPRCVRVVVVSSVVRGVCVGRRWHEGLGSSWWGEVGRYLFGLMVSMGWVYILVIQYVVCLSRGR